jgi:hypothetical protein
MEETLWARALKIAHGRLNHHTPSGLRVCCESALKSAGELLSTRGLAGAGAFGEPPARGAGGCGSDRTSKQWRFGGGSCSCWQISDCALGERLRRAQLAALTPS